MRPAYLRIGLALALTVGIAACERDTSSRPRGDEVQKPGGSELPKPGKPSTIHPSQRPRVIHVMLKRPVASEPASAS